jgi:hypothetical protein
LLFILQIARKYVQTNNTKTQAPCTTEVYYGIITMNHHMPRGNAGMGYRMLEGANMSSLLISG